ncbi:MAG: hypothetical protein M0Z76_06995 [Gammaproteobacteria bacterium]|nr:hypothetical protein [Gammaproteobacteria bacterium]
MSVDQWEKRVHLGALADRTLRVLAVPRISRAINLTAIVLFAAGLAHWTWTVMAPNEGLATVSAHAPAVPVAMDVDSVVRAHLFGDSPRTRLAAIPLSHLALTVSGLVMGHPGMALIGAPGQSVKPYRVGDTVAEGVVLEAVTPDRAIVRQAGRLQSLPLYPPGAVPAHVDTGGTQAAVPVLTASSPGLAAPVHVAVDAAVLRHLAAMAPTKIGQWLQPGPVGGLVVKAGTGNAFTALRLQPGDTIEEINGRPVNSLGTAMAAYAAATRTGNISLDVARKGHIQVLRYTLP